MIEEAESGKREKGDNIAFPLKEIYILGHNSRFVTVRQAFRPLSALVKF